MFSPTFRTDNVFYSFAFLTKHLTKWFVIIIFIIINIIIIISVIFIIRVAIWWKRSFGRIYLPGKIYFLMLSVQNFGTFCIVILRPLSSSSSTSRRFVGK